MSAPRRLLVPTTVEQIVARRQTILDAETFTGAQRIVDDVRSGGELALREHAERFDGLSANEPLVLGRNDLARAVEELDVESRRLLERTAERIAAFAEAQREAVRAMEVPVPGGRAGHEVVPVERAGCYAPGGRFPLPSSVLMTGVTARVAGVSEVWVASPRPTLVTRAAAGIAGASGLLCAGGAQAIAALAYGAFGAASVDVVVGPGNRWVTAAKKLVCGDVGIDMLAGPSELVILADASAAPAVVAADLLAQAEHDPDALPVLVTTAPSLAEAVELELVRQLEDLPTQDVARAALANGGVLCVADLDAAARACDALAPEHLEVLTEDPDATAASLSHYGALFLGSGSAEVLGDYGVGPNHVLPTGRGARFGGGLSVLSFLRVRTWLRLDPASEGMLDVVADAASLARLEGLEGHARSAEMR